MSDKDKDAKTSSIAKTLNKVEDRLEKGRTAVPLPKGLRMLPRPASCSVPCGRFRPVSYCDSIMIRGSLQSMAIPRRVSTATKMMRNGSLRSVLLKSHDISGLCTPME